MCQACHTVENLIMSSKHESFSDLLKQFEYHYDLRTAFDDFLTMTICAFGQNPKEGKSYDEDLYLQTIEKYKSSDLRHNFTKLLARLTFEMEERMESSEGFDVLGEFYELNLARKGASQFFTPWPICMFMAKAASEQAHSGKQEDSRPLRILDPSCGSGRTLLAASRVNGPRNEYYGVDIDATCSKMCALNLFLSGLFKSEVLCADALVPEDFRTGYRSSFLPFGLFRVTAKESSQLWHLLKNSWGMKSSSTEYSGETKKAPDGDQLTIF